LVVGGFFLLVGGAAYFNPREMRMFLVRQMNAICGKRAGDRCNQLPEKLFKAIVLSAITLGCIFLIFAASGT